MTTLLRASRHPTTVSGEPSTDGPNERDAGDDEPEANDDGLAGTVDALLGGPGPGSAPERDLDPAADADVPGRLRARFWVVVAVVNVGVLAAALGAMLVAFRGDWGRGGPLLLVGGLLLARAYQRVRAFERERASGE